MIGAHASRRGFTLVELLVVIAIILVLAGMILAVREPIKRSILRARTQVLAESIRSGILAAMQARGGGIVPAEHPIAASAAPRRPFVRAGTHTAIPAAGQAYTGPGLTDPAAAGYTATLLLADDICADPDAPAMYGMYRSDLGVLGLAISPITDLKLLPSQRRIETVPDVAGQLAFYRLILGNDVLGDLTRQKAIWTPPDDTALMDGGRLWSPPASGCDSKGSMRLRVAGALQPYRLRGPAFYDAWGNEFLIKVGLGNAIIVMSAGPDGFFRWNPGSDGILSTDPWLDPQVDPPAGDDLPAQRDNIVVGVEH